MVHQLLPRRWLCCLSAVVLVFCSVVNASAQKEILDDIHPAQTELLKQTNIKLNYTLLRRDHFPKSMVEPIGQPVGNMILCRINFAQTRANQGPLEAPKKWCLYSQETGTAYEETESSHTVIISGDKVFAEMMLLSLKPARSIAGKEAISYHTKSFYDGSDTLTYSELSEGSGSPRRSATRHLMEKHILDFPDPLRIYELGQLKKNVKTGPKLGDGLVRLISSNGAVSTDVFLQPKVNFAVTRWETTTRDYTETTVNSGFSEFVNSVALPTNVSFKCVKNQGALTREVSYHNITYRKISDTEAALAMDLVIPEGVEVITRRTE